MTHTQPAQPAPAQPAPARQATILVADDEQDIRELAGECEPPLKGSYYE